MGIRRRGLLAGLGSAGNIIGQYMLQDQRQQAQQGFELQKLRLNEVNALTNNLASHPDQLGFFLQGADANPLLRGLDLSSLKDAARTMGTGQLNQQLNTATSPENIPADLGVALTGKTGTAFPSASLPNAAQFGAQADQPDLPPELQALLHTATSRLGQLQQEKETKLGDVGRTKFAESQATTAGTNAANNANFPAALQQKIDALKQTGPVEAANAGLTVGAQKRAGLAPDIVQGETRAAGAKAGAEENAKLSAQLAQNGITGQKQQAALQLGDDYRNESQGFRVQEGSFRSLLTAAKQPSAAGDLSIIFSYMKLLDPPSSVREGEQATAQNAAGIPAQVRNWYNRVMTGERLAPEQRNDFVKQAFGIYTSASEGQKRVTADYLKRATMLGVPPELVIRQSDPTLAADPFGKTNGSALDRILNGGPK
jgi:hypothetical protein